MKPVFFYGLFMDADLLRAKGLHPSNARLAHVRGHGLRIGERATLEISPDECAYGSIMELSEEELAKLYSDISVADYVPRQLLALDMQGQELRVISYILPIQLVSGSNSQYANALARIADKVGLPGHYVAEIKTWI